MRALLIVFTWLIASFIFGVVGMGIGPGVVMMFCGIILGFSGAIAHSVKYVYGLKLNGFLFVLTVSIISLLVTVLSFGGDTRNFEIIIFLWVFYVIPSLGIYFLIQFMLSRCEKVNSR